jgi:hypothetical protein
MSEQTTQLAIVTGEFAPDLSDGGTKLATSLAEHNIDSEPVMWNNPSVDWTTYDAVLLRSCWDYPNDRERFQVMLQELEEAPVQVCNPLQVIQWNLHKSYIIALDESGVTVPETTVVEQGAGVSLETIFEKQNHDEMVIKPAIGAMSEQVRKRSIADLSESGSKFSEQVEDHDILVQEFIPEIETGERSMVFFAGEYSHAWNSLTTEEDITAFDGSDTDYEPTARIQEQGAAVIQSASDILGMTPRDLPYARVDYVPREGELVLMELELIEPFLGFDRGENTVQRFTEVLVSYFNTTL